MDSSEHRRLKNTIWLGPLIGFMSIFVFCITYFVYFYAHQQGRPGGYTPALLGTAVFLFFTGGLTASALPAGYLRQHLAAFFLSCLVAGVCFAFLLMFLTVNTLGA
jgi:hypothetical protein